MNKEKKVIDEERIIEDMKRYAPNTQYDAHDYSRYGNEIRLEFLIQDALGLIYSLQDENRQLLEKSNNLRDELISATCDLGNAKELIEQQKAEIERLTEKIDQRREMMHRMDCNYATEFQKNAELQKQVDELKEQNNALIVVIDGCKNGDYSSTKIINALNSFYRPIVEEEKVKAEQAVKDTAKEILQAVFEDVGEFYAGDIVEELAKRYGVEVE